MERYRVLVLGDFHFGESYTGDGERVVTEHGYEHSTVHLRPFVDACDSVVVNLETPLVRPEDVPSPLIGKKTYLHWGDPEATGRQLQNLGVDAVSLANNHTVDHGPEGLETTFRTLSDFGISWFGAGRTLDESRRPFRLALPERVGGGELHFHGSYQYSTRSDQDFGFYADQNSSGCAPLSVGDVPAARGQDSREDAFQVAFPHWGSNYVWRGPRQYRLAHRFLAKDYDLVLGHGGHNMQEIHRKQQRWVVYGIGNGNFQSRGRWQRYEEENGILPFSFWAVLEVQRQDGRRSLQLKLYPVYSDNSVTNFQPGPVGEADFKQVLETLASRPARPWRFNNPARSSGQDDLGFYICLDLGGWDESQRPSRLAPVLESGDPGDWPLRSPNPELEDMILSQNGPLSSRLMALSTETAGGQTQWLTDGLALLDHQGKRMITQSYMAHESSLGSAVIRDKVLAATFFEDAGVNTPETVVVDTVDAAVEAATRMSGPVVLKPRAGKKSRGVSTGLITDDEVREAFILAKENGSEVIVQQHVEAAEELRVMATPTEAVAVIRRVLPHVTGDGLSTIGQLIEDKNQQRQLNPSLRNRPIPIDALTYRHLSREGYALDSILDLGQTISVRNIAGLSVGADAHQALETSDSSITETAAAAVAAIPGLGWGGVDLILEKDTQKPYVIEINAQAAYGAALFPAYGKPRDVAQKVWQLRYAATAPEIHTPPEHPAPRPHERPLFHGAEAIQANAAVPFAELFTESLRRQNYQIISRNERVLNVVSPEGADTWVTTGGRTAADRVSVGSVMRRHRWVRQLLDLAEVPSTRAREVTTTRQLKRFTEGRVREIILAPFADPWKGPDAHVLTADQVLQKHSLPTRMWAQARPANRRVRVLATREKSWVITTKSGSRSLNKASITAASEIAVQAVRAVPELHWAAVDVLVRPRRIRENQPNAALVEGVTLAPEFSVEDHIIAGDFDAFVRRLVEPSVTRSYT